MKTTTAVMRDAALEYAERGAPVFPVWWVWDDLRCACGDAACDGNIGKHPIGPAVPHGLLNATTDVATIRRWWMQYPRANIGTTTTWCTVLDVDPRHAGDVTLAALEEQHGALPDTAEVLTGGGGRHLYFRPVAGVRNSSGRVGAGLDIRGEGGYVLLPPSNHKRPGTYVHEVLHPLFETPLATMPAWLVALATRPDNNGHGTASSGAVDWAAKLAGAPEGQRRAVACEVAGHFLGLLGPARVHEVEQILLGYAARCVPQFPPNEAVALVRDLARRDARRRPSHESAGPAADINGDQSASPPATLNAADQDLSRATACAVAALVEANDPPFIFRFGGGLARVERGEDGRMLLQPVTLDRMRNILARVARWALPARGKAPEDRPAHPPLPVCRNILAEAELPLPVLERVVAVPTFTAAGALLARPGYHAASRTFYAPAPGLVVPTIPTPVPPDVLATAVHVLREPLHDFPFAGDADRAHALAALLLVPGRAVVDGPTPLHLTEAPIHGTGKSLLTEVISVVATGQPAPALTGGGGDDEWRKRLTAKLKTSPGVIRLDNLTEKVDAGSLAAVLTTTLWEDRALGGNDVLRLPNKALWLASGNNALLSGEIARRVVLTRLDAATDRPWLRDGFRHPDLLAWTMANHADLVWAVCICWQAWLDRGRPLGTVRLGGFESWSTVLGGLLDVMGVPGFLGNLNQLYDTTDAEGANWRRLVGAWWGRFAAREVGVADLFGLITDPELDGLDLGLGDGSDRSQRTRLGKALSRMRDRHFGPLRITAAGERTGAQRWRLVDTGKAQG
jgi:hypothetical protein